jgi:hypothetical protein
MITLGVVVVVVVVVVVFYEFFVVAFKHCYYLFSYSKVS